MRVKERFSVNASVSSSYQVFIRLWIEVDNAGLREHTGVRANETPSTHMNDIAIAFLSTVLTVVLVEFRFRSVQFTRVAIGNEGDVDNVENRLIGIPHLIADEEPTVGTERFVVDRQIHPFAGYFTSLPHVVRTLLDDLDESLGECDQRESRRLTPHARATSLDSHQVAGELGHGMPRVTVTKINETISEAYM